MTTCLAYSPLCPHHVDLADDNSVPVGFDAHSRSSLCVCIAGYIHDPTTKPRGHGRKYFSTIFSAKSRFFQNVDIKGFNPRLASCPRDYGR